MRETAWCVLVPQKSLARAKGRLELDPGRRRAVAEAMLRDTVAAAVATADVDRVVVVWADRADTGTLPAVDGFVFPGLGLNEALVQAADRVRRDDPAAGVVVLPGDLPALTPGELSRCLDRARVHPRAFLPDADGVGTTVLTAMAGSALAPAYGGASALAHAASGVHPLDPTGLDSVRTDVDDLDSLRRALELGCGQHTRAAWAGLGRAPVRPARRPLPAR